MLILLFFENIFSYWSGTIFIGPKRDLEQDEDAEYVVKEYGPDHVYAAGQERSDPVLRQGYRKNLKYFLGNQDEYEDIATKKKNLQEYNRKLDFDEKLYFGLEQAISRYFQKPGRNFNCNRGVPSNDPQYSRVTDQEMFLNEIDKEYYGLNYDFICQRPASTGGKTAFNVLDWLTNSEGDKDPDPEEELQQLMTEEKKKKFVRAMKVEGRMEKEEEEVAQIKESRFRRFLKWAKNKLKM